MSSTLRVKLPAKVGLQPAGAVAVGAMPSLTACAKTEAAKQRPERMNEACMVSFGGKKCSTDVRQVQMDVRAL